MEGQKKAYCRVCGDYRNFRIQSEQLEIERNGRPYRYAHVRGFCVCCGKQIDVPALNTVNQVERNRAFYGAIRGAQ